ncbi:MAG TPA: hypothetical protein VJA87_01745 [Candidatus Paceibacterota bacterium]
MSFQEQRHTADPSVRDAGQGIDRAIEDALRDKVQLCTPEKLTSESFKNDVVEEVVVSIVEQNLGRILPRQIRPLVKSRLDWHILRVIKDGAYGEQTRGKRVEAFLRNFAL